MPFSPELHPHLPAIAVIGAGVGGLVTALTLQETGYPVTLYEQSKTIGPESCSWMSGGMLAPWCEAADTDPAVIQRGVMALDWWEKHFKGFSRNGSLLLSSARDRSEIARYGAHTGEHVSVNAQRISELEPALSHLFEEGLFYPKEGHLDPREALSALPKSFKALKGKIKLGQGVKASELPEDIIIDCRGLAARDQLPNLRGVRGEMLRIRTDEAHFSRPIRLLHLRESIYIVPRAKGEIMVGSSSVETDWDGPVTVRTAARYLEACERLHPALGQAEVIELGAGVRPAYPNNLPEITREGRIIYLNGFYRHGWLLSPWGAQEVLKEIQDFAGIKPDSEPETASPPNEKTVNNQPSAAPPPTEEKEPKSGENTVQAVVNGKNRFVPETLLSLVSELGFREKTVATAINNIFIPASRRAETKLQTGDRIEIVTPMQGG